MTLVVGIKKKVKSQIRERLVPWLLNKNLLLTRTTTRAAIEDFLARVRPVRTEHELIRIGGNGDGGYLIPDDLAGVRRCFSPGVSEIADFEWDLANRGITCSLADYSVDAPPRHHPSFDFEKRFLGLDDDDVFIRLDSWAKKAPPDDRDMILQMDIEGAEYAVLLDADAELLQRFRIIVVEFHEIQALTDRIGYELIQLVFRKLLRHFDVVHIHPNNARPPTHFEGLSLPQVIEVSFLRRDRSSLRRPATGFPHPLDRANVPANPDYSLPTCWYG